MIEMTVDDYDFFYLWFLYGVVAGVITLPGPQNT
jgi:hypothetical protein